MEISLANTHPLQKSVPNDSFKSNAVLLIFLFCVIEQIFLISISVLLIRKIKLITKPLAKMYYLLVMLYIVAKMALVVFLEVQIIKGIPEFKNIQPKTVENIFDNNIAIGDCILVQMFLVSFKQYMTLSFSVFGNKKVEKNISRILNTVQFIAFFSLVVPIILLNLSFFSYEKLNIFNMSANCLCVVVFIFAFFFMNFKMTGLVMDKRSSTVIKRVYALSLILLFSRLIMSILEVWVQINTENGNFFQYIDVILENQENEFVVLALCFIGYLVILLLSEWMGIMLSVRENILLSLNETSKPRSNVLEESLLTSDEDDFEQIISNTDVLVDSDFENARKTTASKTKVISDSYYGLSKIEDPNEIEIVEKLTAGTDDVLCFKGKWQKSNKFYFVRKLGNISSYIVEEILNEIDIYVTSDVKVINPMKILQKSNEDSVFIIEKFMHENLERKIEQMIASTLKEKINLSIKIAKAIKVFHHCLKIGHGVINPKNVLFDDDGRVYLTGFGMESLKKYLSLTTDYTNISIYTSVELLGSNRQKTITKPSKAADIYSFGIIFYELVANNFKYRNLKLDEIRNKFVKENTRPKIPDGLDEEIKKLMRKCWQENPGARPEIDEVILNLEKLENF